MNILPHKSWHVRNKDNIERVRRDEEKARLEEEERARRAALADQEARTSFLRAKARAEKKTSGEISTASSAIVPASEESRHINFFQDIEDGLKQGSNTEYEAEKKAEQEKQEKAIGLLTYLGQSASEKQGNQPWSKKKHHKTAAEQERDARDCKRKDAIDPLTSIKKYLAVKDEFEHKKDKKHKKEHKKKKKKKQEERSSKKKTIEELRAERLKREQLEREREKKLLSSSKGEKTSEKTDENPYRYNSQFNPDFVRRPRNTYRQRYKPYE